MEAINQLIKMRYELKLSDSNKIDYKYVGNEDVNLIEAAPWFELIKSNKQSAIDYLKTIIKLTVNIRDGVENSEYYVTVVDCFNNELRKITLNENDPAYVYYFIRREYIDNDQFNNILSIYTKATGVFTYYGTSNNGGIIN